MDFEGHHLEGSEEHDHRGGQGEGPGCTKSNPAKDIKKELAKMGYPKKETTLPEEITIGSESDGPFEAVSVKKERVERYEGRKVRSKTPEHGVP